MRLQWQFVMTEELRFPGCDVTSEKCWKCAKQFQVNGILLPTAHCPDPISSFPRTNKCDTIRQTVNNVAKKGP